MKPDVPDDAGEVEEWEALAAWWIAEGSRDPVYADDVLPWLDELVVAAPGWLLDVGCGEGQAMRHLDVDRVLGCDATMRLLAEARRSGPVVRCLLPHLPWLRSGAVTGAVALFVLEHVRSIEALFTELARVVAAGGRLVVIGNHPAYTAPGAGPIIDGRDGAVLWRWGPYLSRAIGAEPVGPGSVTFHHRPLSDLLTTAAEAGWSLERLDERGLSPEAVGRSPSLAGQEQLPRMIGIRWRRAG